MRPGLLLAGRLSPETSQLGRCEKGLGSGRKHVNLRQTNEDRAGRSWLLQSGKGHWKPKVKHFETGSLTCLPCGSSAADLGQGIGSAPGHAHAAMMMMMMMMVVMMMMTILMVVLVTGDGYDQDTGGGYGHASADSV